MDHLATNIHQLRIEADLTLEDIAGDMMVDKDTIQAWEDGTQRPTEEELKELCTLLRIHEEDILSRDIAEERKIAGVKMKKDKNRTDYNWYFGNKKVWAAYIGMSIIVPLIFILIYVVLKPLMAPSIAEALENETASIIMQYLKSNYVLIYCYEAASFVQGVFLTIMYIRKHPFHFQWWYLWFIGIILSVWEAVALVGFLPGYIYIIYQAVFKRGKNR